MNKNDPVFLSLLNEYEEEKMRVCLEGLLLSNHLLDFVKPGCKVAIKANLVAVDDGSKAITTNPVCIKVLAKMLEELGAKVVIGDSPGGLFSDIQLNPIYKKLKLHEIENDNIKLNHNYNHHQVNLDEFKVAKDLDVCDWLTEADFIINFAKLKSHGMLSLSAASKNMFGGVPGSIKLEYHYKYNSHTDFANMLIDVQTFYKPVLHIVDGVIGMEGNGPTAGSPKFLGIMFASTNPFNIDMVISKIIKLPNIQVPFLVEAKKRNLCEEVENINCNIDYNKYIIEDWDNIIHKDTIEFYTKGKFSFIGKIAKKVLETKPVCKKKKCIGCKKCFNICPAKAITMKNGKPVIDRSKCIKCFCCQEFCPVGAMIAHHTFIARIIR